MAKIIKTNMSGDTMEFAYESDSEAEALFDWHCKTAKQCELHLESNPQWHVVWNRNLDKCFDCWS